jgi:hypothetical protein
MEDGAHDSWGVGDHTDAMALMTGTDAVHCHSRAIRFGIEVGKTVVAILKGSPEESASLVTMLGSCNNAGRAMTEVACSASATMIVNMIEKTVEV